MKAILLAAGYATRLYPLTINTPKPLLPIKKDKPIINYIIDEICTIKAVDCVYVITNDKFYSHFLEWQKTTSFPLPVKVLNDGTASEETKLGAIGDIMFTIEKECLDDELLIIAGDTFFTYRLNDCYKFYMEKNKDCVVAKTVDDIELLKQFAVALLDKDNIIIDLVEKPMEPKSNTAIFATYFYKRDTLALIRKYLADGNKPDAPGYFLQWLYKRKAVAAYKMEGDCYDIGNLKSYEEVKRKFGDEG